MSDSACADRTQLVQTVFPHREKLVKWIRGKICITQSSCSGSFDHRIETCNNVIGKDYAQENIERA